MLLKYPKKIKNNSSLRLIILYSSIYITSSLILLGFIFWSTMSYIYQQMNHHIEFQQVNAQHADHYTSIACGDIDLGL